MIPVLNSILDSVVDTIAPPTPAFENFIYHWEKFMVNYLEWTADGKCSETHVELTNIPGHLEIVQQIILTEDKNEVTTSLCMEYILKNDLLNMLVKMAEQEKLIGIRILVLKCMTNLIGQLKHPVLAHQSVYGPVQKLISLCNFVLYNKWQHDQIQFLHTLCSVLNNQQNIAIIFFSFEIDNTFVGESESLKELSSFNKLNVLDCVLSYINTKSTEVFGKCCDCILMLTKLSDEFVKSSIIKRTNLCSTLSNHLKDLYYTLPTTLDFNGLEIVELSWRENYNATYSNDVTKFFCWLDFTIEVIKDGQLQISCTLCETLRFSFFNKLFVTTESIPPSSIFVLKKIYKAATDTPLNYTMNSWLQTELDCFHHNTPSTPIDILITLSATENEIYIFLILSFFTDILFSLDKEMLDFMVLRFVNNRHYYEKCTTGSWSDEEDEREKKLLLNQKSINTSRTLAPSSIDRIINRFLALIPQNFQSDPLITFKDHITSTKNTYEDIFVKCKSFIWPSEAINSLKLYAFDEGPFLRMIFSKISFIPQQNPAITLQLKIILIFLSFLPHPYLHEYLLNSTIPLKCNVPSFYTILDQVLRDLHTNLASIPNYNSELINARKNILNSTPNKLFCEKNNTTKLFENAVIIEELCKELVAVLFVKYHHSYLV